MVFIPVDYLYFGISILLVYIINKIIARIIHKAAVEKIPADLENILLLFIRFLMVIVILYSAVIFLNIGQSTVLGLSIFLGSIISFGSIHTIQNFISGMYILITEPFSINDMVRIGNSEGVVTEISLNYTSLLNFEGLIEYVPNKKIIGSTIINFDLKVSEAVKGLSWNDKLKSSFDDREITRYTFVWGAPLIDYDEMKRILDKICKKYEKVFGYLPEYIPDKINHRFEFSFALSADNPMIILKNKTDFLDEITVAFH